MTPATGHIEYASCSRCGARTFHALTSQSSRIILDADPDKDGTILVDLPTHTGELPVVVTQRASRAHTPPPLFTPHHATCRGRRWFNRR